MLAIVAEILGTVVMAVACLAPDLVFLAARALRSPHDPGASMSGGRLRETGGSGAA
ncbi:MAG TPA: hypothetical protein VFQ45_08260 [Longimicrobium sp.]|nr:hypothetical protein [Longimicrobium sp.]